MRCFSVSDQHEAAHAGAKHAHHDLFAIVHSVDQYLQSRKLTLQRMCEVETVQLRNRIIQDCDVRPRLLREFQGGSSVRGLSHHLVVRRRVQ